MKRVIIYYSLTDNTKKAAEEIAEKIGADLIRVETMKPMPTTFFGQMMHGGRQATFGLKPAIKELPESLEAYQEIILGTPIWAGKQAPAILTLLQKKEVRKKVIGVFTCSGGGDHAKCILGLQKILPKLQYTLALADRKNPLSQENPAKNPSME